MERYGVWLNLRTESGILTEVIHDFLQTLEKCAGSCNSTNVC
jgi:hypothetical protein